MIDTINQFVDTHHDTYKSIAQTIHANPEVSNYEFLACETLANQLKLEGFSVKVDVAGHRTGFDARYKSKKPGPVIVFLAEYDALAGIGHACGHNLFGTTSLLSAAALKTVIDEVGGEIRVYGTPGEEGGENGSAKGSFVREGYLNDVDVALCVHPGHRHHPTSLTLAVDPVDVEFFGRTSHAAANPELGINALDAVIQVFNAMNALRQQLPSDVRIHGIITHGGDAPNVIPDHASARFYLRALTRTTLNDVSTKFENIVKAAALATGCTYSYGLFQNAVDNTILVPSFDQIYRKHLEALGETFAPNAQAGGLASSDVGNISQVVPTIQPIININNTPMAGHSIEFREAAISNLGLDSIALGAKVMAHTALDLIQNPHLIEMIKEEHRNNVTQQ